MDSFEFIQRFREAQQAAGNRPVEVVIQNDRHAVEPTIRFAPAEGKWVNELQLPQIIITTKI